MPLPNKNEFCGSLNIEGITDEDYEHAKTDRMERLQMKKI